jgi:2-dehydropantoate 2-reductase
VRVCIVGAGAIGGWIGARLAASGAAQVSAIARGATLAALRQHGWRLQSGDTFVQAPARVAERADDLGEQDLVIITVKSTAMTEICGRLSPLLGAATAVLPFMNGVPWWFGHGTELGDEPLEAVDPGGTVAAVLPVSRVLGGVVHAGCMTSEPGFVQHRTGNHLILGEARGGASARADAAGAVLRRAGFDVAVTPNVRYDIWYKLWGNMTMNPVSAITGATLDSLLADPLVRDFCSEVMREAAAIGERLGSAITETPEDRHEVTARIGAFKSSMLQDVEAGRPLELDAVVGVVREIGCRLGMPTPNTNALLGLARLFARTRGLYPPG